MALPWALAVLSLLPLLSAQSPKCFNFTVPLTNATLDQITGKWFYIASAYRRPEFKKSASMLQSVFFYLAPNYTEDTVLVREYWTMTVIVHLSYTVLLVFPPFLPGLSENQCIYNTSNLKIQWENGTFSKYEAGEEVTGYLLFTKDPGIFMIVNYPEDKQNMGLSLNAPLESSSAPLLPQTVDKPVATQEQMREFYETITCMGMDKSEIMYTDEKKDQCGPLEKEQEERKKENEGSPENT
ncbi:Alpha-1-acid glycoprotein [Pteropus alecto]|uniref:Alpha-1-acid glycoprotein n=1 Tax=Pteropus alecto TaxID=9402 RepID=L5KA35_PTEAL|nr:Alpha-1-acid glycoprotein [Pteropus alecto]